MITQEQLEGQTASLDKITAAAAAKAQEAVAKLSTDSQSELISRAIDIVDAVQNVYGSAASELALQFFEETTGLTGELYDPTEDEYKYVRGEVVNIVSGKDGEALIEAIGRLAANQVGRQYNNTTIANASRANVRYARIPTGVETCGFCLMLASRGFCYTSEWAAGLGNHYHEHCKCKVVAEVQGGVQGYGNGEAYANAYNQAYSELGGNQGLYQMWLSLPESDRQARIDRHNGSESNARRAYNIERIGDVMVERLYG